MPVFGFSYKSDSSAELFGKVTCDCVETAITMLSEIKRLPEEDVLKIFDITKLEPKDEDDIFIH